MAGVRFGRSSPKAVIKLVTRATNFMHSGWYCCGKRGNNPPFGWGRVTVD